MKGSGKTKRIITVMVTILIIFMVCMGYYAAMGGNKTALTNSEERLLPIYSVETEEKTVAISFDAAWGNEYTDDILKILEEYDARATFFLVGFWVDEYPENVKAIADSGNEIGSHSATHPDLTTCDRSQIEQEFDDTAQKIQDAAGVKPELFRPPYGAYDDQLMRIAEEKGYKVIQWDVDSLDWKDISQDQIVERVVRNVQNGSIVLFHNNAQYVCQYLPQILEKLTRDGYKITAVGDLILKENYSIDHTGRQFPETDK